MEKTYRLFVKWGIELIPVLVCETWMTPVTHQKMSTVIALHGEPFTDLNHKYPCNRRRLTLPAAQVIIEEFILVSAQQASN